MKFALCLAVAVVAALSVHAADEPPIKVKVSGKFSVALTGLTGAELETLRKDLALSGVFTMVPAADAEFTISGNATADLQGRVTDRAGKVVLANTYTGPNRTRVHKFANDIVETLTGQPGIAGTKIAFVATKSGRKEIYTCDADGANLVQLTKDNAIAVSPALSADGRSLLYTGYQSGYADVYKVDLGGGSRNRIMKYPGTNSGAAFAPGGGSIAVTLSKDGNPELYITGSGGGGARRLTRTKGVESSPTWSPDGNEIIYSSDDGGSPQLYRISSSGGAPQRLSTGHGYNTEPNWSPDGKKVAFNTRSGGGFTVAVLDLGGGGVRSLGEGEDPVWGANSRHLLCASGGSLILIDAQTGQRTPLVGGLGKISEPAWSRR
jgi:TolB protein